MASELSPRQAQVLLVLARGPLHGYAIGKEIEAATDGAVVLKPGSMYRALDQLLERDCIEEVIGAGSDDERRREYRITRTGRARLREALEDFRALVQAGKHLGFIGEEES